MKKSIMISLAFAAAVLIGCDASPTEVDEAGFGPVTGQWDGRTWHGRGYAVLVNDTLHIMAHRRPQATVYYDETVSLRIPFAGTGTYVIDRDAHLWKLTGGDAGYNAGVSGRLVLTHADVNARRFEGTFDLAGQGPDGTWRLTEVEFDVPGYTSYQDAPPFWRDP